MREIFKNIDLNIINDFYQNNKHLNTIYKLFALNNKNIYDSYYIITNIYFWEYIKQFKQINKDIIEVTKESMDLSFVIKMDFYFISIDVYGLSLYDDINIVKNLSYFVNNLDYDVDLLNEKLDSLRCDVRIIYPIDVPFYKMYEDYDKYNISTISGRTILENKIHYIAINNGNFVLISSTPNNKGDFDIHKMYNDDFFEIHNNIVNELNIKNNSGIYFLHGLQGTGKTNYIRNLIQLVKDRRIIFLPPSYINSLSDPSFFTFLMNECKNSILIIEDAEMAITDRKINKTSTVSNLLNISDGLMGDMLGISIICTFNADENLIDPALLRKGRTKVKYKFDKLSLEKTQVLNPNLNQPSTLAEIFNSDEMDYSSDLNINKIGFKK